MGPGAFALRLEAWIAVPGPDPVIDAPGPDAPGVGRVTAMDDVAGMGGGETGRAGNPAEETAGRLVLLVAL